MEPTIDRALEDYLLMHDMRDTSQEYYNGVASVYKTWSARSPIERALFDARTVSMFIRDKQAAQLSTHYLKSLRDGLKTLLRSIGDTGKVRSVKLKPLSIEIWNAVDVAALVAAVPRVILAYNDSMRALYRRHFWCTIIPAAWYTGLSQGDLFRLDESHCAADGRIIIDRNRTGKRVVTWMPPELLERVSGGGRFWQLQTSAEVFRNEFKKIVKHAGLKGSFKKLRKSSGSLADQLDPGRGHLHLGNTRKVFELHYLGNSVDQRQPLRLPSV